MTAQFSEYVKQCEIIRTFVSGLNTLLHCCDLTQQSDGTLTFRNQGTGGSSERPGKVDSYLMSSISKAASSPWSILSWGSLCHKCTEPQDQTLWDVLPTPSQLKLFQPPIQSALGIPLSLLVFTFNSHSHASRAKADFLSHFHCLPTILSLPTVEWEKKPERWNNS